MSARKQSISTDWSKADAYENTLADYAELPELDDAFFERAERSGRMTDPDETARIARLRDAIMEIWGRHAYDVKGLKRGADGALLLLLEPTGAVDD